MEVVSPSQTSDLIARLGKLVFRIELEDGFGTGFFITRDLALTAFHNVPKEVRNNPKMTLFAHWNGRRIAFRLALFGQRDQDWQCLHDVAVLRAEQSEDVDPEQLIYVDEGLDQRGRDDEFRSHTVSVVGFPSTKDAATHIPAGIPENLIFHAAPVSECGQPQFRETLRFNPNDPNHLRRPDGLSGSPVFDKQHGGIIGIVIGAKQELHATVFAPIIGHWPFLGDISKRVPERPDIVAEYAAPRQHRVAWLALAAVVAALAGLFFALKAPRQEDLQIKLVHLDSGKTEPIDGNVFIHNGEKFRFEFRSSREGYVYVVDRELHRDGSYRDPYLVYPTLNFGLARNRLKPGEAVAYPDPSEYPPSIESRPVFSEAPRYAGEAITVLVYPREVVPLERLQVKPMRLTPDEFPPDGMRLVFPADPRTRLLVGADSTIAVRSLKVLTVDGGLLGFLRQHLALALAVLCTMIVFFVWLRYRVAF
jgi:Trypsin-like peptidase domain